MEVNKIQMIFFTGEEGPQQWNGFCVPWETKTLLRSMTKVFHALQMDLQVHSWHLAHRVDSASLNRMGVITVQLPHSLFDFLSMLFLPLKVVVDFGLISTQTWSVADRS